MWYPPPPKPPWSCGDTKDTDWGPISRLCPHVWWEKRSLWPWSNLKLKKKPTSLHHPTKTSSRRRHSSWRHIRLFVCSFLKGLMVKATDRSCDEASGGSGGGALLWTQQLRIIILIECRWCSFWCSEAGGRKKSWRNEDWCGCWGNECQLNTSPLPWVPPNLWTCDICKLQVQAVVKCRSWCTNRTEFCVD